MTTSCSSKKSHSSAKPTAQPSLEYSHLEEKTDFDQLVADLNKLKSLGMVMQFDPEGTLSWSQQAHQSYGLRWGQPTTADIETALLAFVASSLNILDKYGQGTYLIAEEHAQSRARTLQQGYIDGIRLRLNFAQSTLESNYLSLMK